MQTLTRLLALGLLATCQLDAVEIKTAYTRHYDATEIRTVTQYFGGKLTGQRFRTVVASQADQPSGQYFITKLKDARDNPPVKVRMTLYATDSKDPTEWSWDIQGLKLDKWLYLGLTGSDWPDEDVLPLAWRIELLDANGAVVAEWKSFLWEMS